MEGVDTSAAKRACQSFLLHLLLVYTVNTLWINLLDKMYVSRFMIYKWASFESSINI